MIHVTEYAARRYRELAAPKAEPLEAIAALRTLAPICERAAAFGCTRIRLGNGVRLVIEPSPQFGPNWSSVVDVQPKRTRRRGHIVRGGEQ